MSIKFKRGLKAVIPTSAIAGEPIYTMDTKELYIGNGDGLSLTLVTGVVKVGSAGTPDYLSDSYFEQSSENHIRIKQNTLLSGVDADKVDGKNVDDTKLTTDYLWTAAQIVSYLGTFKARTF